MRTLFRLQCAVQVTAATILSLKVHSFPKEFLSIYSEPCTLRQLKAWLFIRKRPPAKILRNLYSLLIKVLTRLKEIHCINCLTSLSTRKSS